MKVYIVKAFTSLYFSSIDNAVKFLIDEFMNTLSSHNYPNYFLSKWPTPKAWLDAGLYKIFEADLDIPRVAKETDKEIITSLLEKYSKEI